MELESESDSKQFIASDPRHSPESSGLETVNLEEFASESPTIRIFVERPWEFLPLVSLFVELNKNESCCISVEIAWLYERDRYILIRKEM